MALTFYMLHHLLSVIFTVLALTLSKQGSLSLLKSYQIMHKAKKAFLAKLSGLGCVMAFEWEESEQTNP